MTERIKRFVSFVRRQLKWGFVRIPFFALVVFMLWIVSPFERLSLWQSGWATLIVLFARDYLNWVEKKYRS